MKRSLLIVPLFLLLTLGAESWAQEAEEAPQPGVVSVRYFQCPFHTQGEAVSRLNNEWRSVVEELIGEGKLLDFGVLTHAWGDEWNVMDYYVAEDLASFHEAFDEASRRIQQQFPEQPDPPFGELCPRHKDNIYFVVQPPAEEEEGN